MSEKNVHNVPPGFRFHPTDEELINYYLKKKVALDKFDLDHVIREVDLNKLEPWDLREKCKVDASHQTEWYFFSHKDKKYPTGTRTNRATKAGFWKATGRDKAVHAAHTSHAAHKRIGMRKTLVFYRGRAPHGQKTDWIMHEYRLEDSAYHDGPISSNEDGWVVCRVFKKRIHHQKATQPSRTTILASEEEQSSLIDNPSIDHYKHFQVKNASTTTSNCLKLSCKREIDYEDSLPQVPFLHLPQLESPKNTTTNYDILFPDVGDYHGRRPFNPFCYKRSEIFPSPFTSIEMPTLDTSNYTKSLIFGCDDNLVDTYIEETDQWGVLESLPKDIIYHHSSDNVCNSLLSTNCDVDIWKPLL